MRCETTYHGHVQGVGFRAVCREVAAELSLSGWVRNEFDGSVTLVIEGHPVAIDECHERILKRMAHCITRADHKRSEEHRGYSGFEIRR